MLAWSGVLFYITMQSPICNTTLGTYMRGQRIQFYTLWTSSVWP